MKITAPIVILFLLIGSCADAKGCLKGAAVGGVAGHYAGHHGVLGAVTGCIVGRHEAKKRDRQRLEDEQRNRDLQNREQRL
jgi:outer membrane lipoprotein SlyB